MAFTGNNEDVNQGPIRTLVQDAEAFAEMLPRLMASEAIGLDTETTSLSPFDGQLRLVTLAIPGQTYLIDVFAVPDLSPLMGVLGAVKPIKVLHNAKFDQRWLLHHHGLELQSVFDTMLASQLLFEREKHSLRVVAWDELGVALDKSEQVSDWSKPLTPAQLEYAALDAEILLPLRLAMRPKLIQAGLTRVALLEFGVTGVVAAMENAGVAVDVKAWHALLDALKVQHDAISHELQDLLAPAQKQLSLLPDIAPAINLNSSLRLKMALSDLGVVVSDTNENSLTQVRDRHPAIPKLLEYRHLQKTISAYGEGLLSHVHPVTGRIHANFQQLVTSTGRFSCSHPNLQNIPTTPEVRACFAAPPGYKLVIADYSQIELRILAELTGDLAFRRAFEQKLDLHKMTASEMFWVPYDEVTKEQRSQAKGINFGLVYGRGATSLAEQLEVSVERAKELIKRYFETYKGVAAWLEQTGRKAVRERELRSIAGRRALFKFDEHDRSAVASVERQGKNFPIQATNSDILKRAMALIPQALKPFDARLVNCVHDELVVESPAEYSDAVGSAVQETMIAAAREFLQDVPVEVDVHIADAWFK